MAGLGQWPFAVQRLGGHPRQ